MAELEFLYGDGRGLSASINDVPINRDSSLPARAAAEPVLERAVAKPEKKRGFLAASLMVDLPDHRALAQIYQSSISKSAAVKEETILRVTASLLEHLRSTLMKMRHLTRHVYLKF